RHSPSRESFIRDRHPSLHRRSALRRSTMHSSSHGIARNFAAALLLAPLAAVALAQGAAAAKPAGPRTYTIDRNHSSVGFRIRHLVSNVDGRFKDFAGTVTYDVANPEKSSVDMTVQAASIDTDTPKRDEDLRSENFFDVAKYPT